MHIYARPQVYDKVGDVAIPRNGSAVNDVVLDALRLMDLDLPAAFAEVYPGPQFGVAGTRELAGRAVGPLIGTIVKPNVGLSARDLAELVSELALAGINFIKDDELQGNSLGLPRHHDQIRIAIPLRSRLTVAHHFLEEATNQVAVVRGPVVYCVESADLPDGVGIESVFIPRTIVWDEEEGTELLRERASLAVRHDLTEVLADGAFEAVAAGDRDLHDRLVGEAITKHAVDNDAVVLAQASMAGAIDGISVTTPVLTSPELGIRRVAEILSTDSGRGAAEPS